MRRKSERVVNKKTKASPEKSMDKSKRAKTRRRKHSSTSDNESGEEKSPVHEKRATSDSEKELQETSNKNDNTEESQDQVWQVKTAETSGDVGEIQKLKICLTRPPSTPERGDKSPRSKGKHSRATSSSDTPSVDSVEEKRKKHRSRKTSHDTFNNDTQIEQQNEVEDVKPESSVEEDNEVTQSETDQTAEAPVSTTNEEDIPDNSGKSESNENEEKNVVTDVDCKSDADTTVVSPKAETTVVSPNDKTILPDTDESKEESATSIVEKGSPTRKRSASVDKSEILELHPDESKIESSDNEASKQQEEESKEESVMDHQTEVSINQEQNINKETEVENNEQIKSTNESGVLESENVDKEIRQISTDSENENKIQDKDVHKESSEKDTHQIREIEHCHSTQITQEQILPNGQTPQIAANRKRRWGSRPTKLTTQKSITISTDVLKDIIPDVKPVEFDEVIEEKKYRRVEVPEKVERPVLPKIVIDNTENVEYKRKELEKEVKEKDNKLKESLASNRKISIIKDNDSIISRPPSPPKNKQSCILYITNLVRPFTSMQLKNLLLRTGKIVENGFWMDKIKSKCFVQYENEEQAVETRHALHGVKWPVSNPKTLQVDFSTQEAFDKAKLNVETENSQVPGTVEDWLRELDSKKERSEMDKLWERKAVMREWDVGKNEKDKEKDKLRHDDRPLEKRRHRSIERSPEPARKFKKKEEEAPAKLLDDLFRKTKTTPCIYWLPLSAETIAVKEEQRRQHMAEYERRMQEQRRPQRRH